MRPYVRATVKHANCLPDRVPALRVLIKSCRKVLREVRLLKPFAMPCHPWGRYNRVPIPGCLQYFDQADRGLHARWKRQNRWRLKQSTPLLSCLDGCCRLLPHSTRQRSTLMWDSTPSSKEHDDHSPRPLHNTNTKHFQAVCFSSCMLTPTGNTGSPMSHTQHWVLCLVHGPFASYM